MQISITILNKIIQITRVAILIVQTTVTAIQIKEIEKKNKQTMQFQFQLYL